MPKTPIPIATGFYVSESLPISNQRAVNWRPNIPQTDTITDANLFNTEGLRKLIDEEDVSVSKPCRGFHNFNGIPYFVNNTNLYRLEQDNTSETGFKAVLVNPSVEIDGIDRVSIADNGAEMCIVAPPDNLTTGKSYIFTESPDTLTEITDVNFDGPASQVVYISGFFVFAKADGKKFFNSPIQNGLGPYDPLDFSGAFADPDPIRALVAYRNQLYVLGSVTTEIFRPTERVPAPFRRLNGGVVDVGISSKNSITLFGGAFAFVGSGVNESPAVWQVAGGNKRKISTTAIDNELSKLTESELRGIFSLNYAESGDYYYGFTTTNTSFFYSTINGRWHERQSRRNEQLTQYRVSHMVEGYNQIIVGDLQDGRIGILDEDIFDEYDEVVIRFCTTRPFDNLGNTIFVQSIEAVVESGVGLDNDLVLEGTPAATGIPTPLLGGEDPQITLSWSKDGGRFFEGYLSRSMGKIGEYIQRPIWYRAPGRVPRSIVLQFEASAPTKAVLIKAEANVLSA